jgi:hypothetical protein
MGINLVSIEAKRCHSFSRLHVLGIFLELFAWRFVLCEMARYLVENILSMYHCGISVVLEEEIC